MNGNILLNTDSYKASHFMQYPAGTTKVSSYIEARGCDIPGWTKTTFFGLQIFLKEYLSKPITKEMIDEAEEFWSAHGEPFNREGWEYILNTYEGVLPLKIEAAPEGMNIPLGNVLVQVENTDPKVPWLTSYVETALLRAVWYPTTVASQDLAIKRTLRKYMKKTSDSKDIEADMLFKLHDFGARGVSSMESAGIGGAAHLVHFMGTDTVTGALYARKYYGERMAGFSIPASEHSTITVWGGPENEIEAFENMLDKFGGEGKLLACVSDSYSIHEAINKWAKLKDKIINSGGTLVVRPDSGVPEKVVVDVINHLIDQFGADVNSKGYMVLPSYLRVIQGDGINHASIEHILEAMENEGLSADNVAFGMGGAMLQQVNRDTFKFAMKASYAVVDGAGRDVYKDPVGDKTKRSKRGRQALVERDGELVTVRADHIGINEKNLLETVYYNGSIQTITFAKVRKLAAQI